MIMFLWRILFSSSATHTSSSSTTLKSSTLSGWWACSANRRETDGTTTIKRFEMHSSTWGSKWSTRKSSTMYLQSTCSSSRSTTSTSWLFPWAHSKGSTLWWPTWLERLVIFTIWSSNKSSWDINLMSLLRLTTNSINRLLKRRWIHLDLICILLKKVNWIQKLKDLRLIRLPILLIFLYHSMMLQ